MKKNIIITVSIITITIISIITYWNFSSAQTEEHAEHTAEKKAIYTCPMHPSVQSEKPGACPVCGMSLVLRTEKSKHQEMEKTVIGTVTLSPAQQTLANVSTTTAKRMKLIKEIHAVGTIQYAEPNLQHITMRFPGRIEKLYLNYTGQHIKKGQPIANIYSPEIISAQQEFITALHIDEKNILQQAQKKLERWGFTKTQIEHLYKTKKIKDTVTIYSPVTGTVLKKNVEVQQYVEMGENIYDVADLSVVWLYGEIYENEIQFITVGQEIQAITETYPEETFEGTVTFISPVVNPMSRTIQIRTTLPNKNEKLKLDMYMNVMIEVPLPITIAVPTSAILTTGTHSMVWVEKEKGTFEPRTVVVGATADGYTQILNGIKEDELIATSGGYLIDSESQLQNTNQQHQH